MHAGVARSTFGSDKCEKLSGLEVEMSKKCRPLWREAHVKVMVKTPGFGPLRFDGASMSKERTQL